MTNASPILRMKRNDTVPDLTVHLTDSGTPVNLTTATQIRVLAQHDTDLNTHFARVVTGDANGLVVMQWQPTDTAVPGLLNIELEVKWPGTDRLQTFPGANYLQVLITEDLG